MWSFPFPIFLGHSICYVWPNICNLWSSYFLILDYYIWLTGKVNYSLSPAADRLNKVSLAPLWFVATGALVKRGGGRGFENNLRHDFLKQHYYIYAFDEGKTWDYFVDWLEGIDGRAVQSLVTHSEAKGCDDEVNNIWQIERPFFIACKNIRKYV